MIISKKPRIILRILRSGQLGFALPSVILILVILIAVALIITGGTRYYSYKTFQELKEVVKEPETVRPEQVIDETADWETYRNEEYGYQIKCPPDWESKERSLMSNLGHLDFIWLQSNEDEFNIDIWDFSFYSYDQLTEPPPGGIDPDTIEKKEIIIDDQPATELSYVAVGDGGSGSRRIREVFIQKNQLLYKIRSTDSKKCDQIFSTFKFIKK